MLTKNAVLLALLLLATPAWALEIKLQWADNSTNEDGFAVERRLDSDAWLEIGKTAANITAFSDPAPVAGRKHAYRILAFNAGGKSVPSNEAVIQYFAAYPIVLNGTVLPEQGFLAVSLAVAKGATASELRMEVFDPDMANEGELWINGNGPIQLFGAQGVAANNRVVKTISFPVPVAWWREGENSLRFVHSSTLGYEIRSAQVIFAVPLLAPTGLKIAVP